MVEIQGRGFGAPDRMGDWTHETPGHLNKKIDTHEVHGIPRVESGTESGLLEKLRQPTAQKVITFLLVAAAAGAYLNWFRNSENMAEAAGQNIEQKAFDEQKALWLERMHSEGLTEADINSVLDDPELKTVYEEMAAGNYDSFDEYLTKRSSSEQ